MNDAVLERFYAKVDIHHPRECWWWIGAVGSDGYGSFKWRDRIQGAHRVAFEIWNNRPVKSGLHVMHRCDERQCVNPFHLEEGTPRQNAHDKIARGRAPDVGGERNPSAKISDADARAILDLAWVVNGLSQPQIAARFGISQATVSAIKHGRRRVAG